MAYAITLTTDLGGDTLLFRRMHAREHLGQLFSYRLEMLSTDQAVDLRKLLGTPMTVNLKPEGGGERYFNGIVSAAEQTGFETIGKVLYATYAVTLVPKPWLLTRKVDCRIYTALSVPDIIKQILGEFGYADVDVNLSGNYAARDYCVLYRESYFNFISRLMEQEGIYYFFTHTADKHTMVLADASSAHVAVAPFATLPYCPPTQRGSREAASVSAWTTARSVNALKCELTDFDPLAPTAALLVTASVDNGVDYHNLTELTVFDFPGDYTRAGKSSTGQRYAQVRTQALNAQHLTHAGSTDAWGLATGNLFTLKDFPLRELNQEYLVVGTRIDLEGVEYASGDIEKTPFACTFEVIASQQPYRSLPLATKPIIAGLQTAIVTGSDTDEDIVVDKYGRVQVTFHWNKPDKPNAQSSCPVRVASSWAGKAWGAISIPRVGQEVVVSFLEGDPDQPLIIGSVYNANHMPPYTLPDNKTQSGIVSCSNPDGSASTFNAIRFEDKKGSEDLYLHAQKDMHEDVVNDHVVTIGNDETSSIKNDQTSEIKHNRKHTVDNDDTLTVSNNGSTSIGKEFKLEAGSQIELVTGASSITMKSSGEIEIKGVNIKITGDMSVKIDGQSEVGIKAGATMDIGAGASLKAHSDAMLEVAGGAMTTVKGPMLTLKGDGMAQLSGGIIMIG
ncbi:type VI secretion system Vgr family protein [mine drainage metagenome]|uniref:Type VI secretion system Vgr family protein n=4 Tax=mine drainage metagenome TaxID=410659 RepID=T1CE64_9ZZZZ